MKALVRYLKESRDELLKVRWPTRAVTTQYSIIVIASVVIATAVFGLVDYGLNAVLELVLEIK